MNRFRLICFLLAFVWLATDSTAQTYGEHDLITSREDQEVYLVGRWQVLGSLQGTDGFELQVEGEIEFREPRAFNHSLVLVISLEGNPMVRSECTGEGRWKWLETGKGDIDGDLSGACACTSKALDEVMGPMLLNMIEASETPVCDELKRALAVRGIAFRKNRIDLSAQSPTEQMNISLIRTGPPR